MPVSVPPRVRAVFVTWNPDLARLFQAVNAVAEQVDGVVIVDNGSSCAPRLAGHFARSENVTVLCLGENLGIGAALNEGVRRALEGEPAWILTMDQDTLVSPGAVRGILSAHGALDERSRLKCGILALRSAPQPASIWLTRYADRLLIVGERGEFVERRGVITSGNLVRADLAREIPFNESMFIDQVDFDFCYSVRYRGASVLQQRVVTTDHILGQRYDDVDVVHPYENAQRFYYIVRNSTYMVLRRRLLVRYYLVQILVIAGAFVSINGYQSLPLGVAIIVRGIADAVAGRMGKREYPLLKKGRR